MKSVMKCSVVAVASATLGLFPVTLAMASPANPGMAGTAAPNAQCGTSAASGAFNAHNSVYGPNSMDFGLDGGSGGGQTGINNSTVCGAR